LWFKIIGRKKKANLLQFRGNLDILSHLEEDLSINKLIKNFDNKRKKEGRKRKRKETGDEQYGVFSVIPNATLSIHIFEPYKFDY